MILYLKSLKEQPEREEYLKQATDIHFQTNGLKTLTIPDYQVFP
jgi:hypothetical protein